MLTGNVADVVLLIFLEFPLFLQGMLRLLFLFLSAFILLAAFSHISPPVMNYTNMEYDEQLSNFNNVSAIQGRFQAIRYGRCIIRVGAAVVKFFPGFLHKFLILHEIPAGCRQYPGSIQHAFMPDTHPSL
jgi:hypothetical protein